MKAVLMISHTYRSSDDVELALDACREVPGYLTAYATNSKSVNSGEPDKVISFYDYKISTDETLPKGTRISWISEAEYQHFVERQ
ncbi:hypothetical protein [Hahella ganghwensis]|uniref:hypothetical protein n=1 Tax=Hahella ganghwensis TaxID=286420 RepID=UPI00036F114C|nr:hypothetical protein [Hahella ganghwensis]